MFRTAAPAFLRGLGAVLGFLLLVSPPADAADAAMLQLFKILRDRGSITAEEYQLLMDLSAQPEANKAPVIELPKVSDLAPQPTLPTPQVPKPVPPGTPTPTVVDPAKGTASATGGGRCHEYRGHADHRGQATPVR